MNTIAEEQITEPQVLQAVVVEEQQDTAIAPLGDAPMAPVYDNEALKVLVQEALRTAADPARLVTDAVLNRILSRIQGYIPDNAKDFYDKVLGSTSFNNHIQLHVRNYVSRFDIREKSVEETQRYLETEAAGQVAHIANIEVDAAARRMATSGHMESHKLAVVDQLERIANEMRQEKNAAALLAAAVSPQLTELASAHLQAEAGVSLESVQSRIQNLIVREKQVGILGASISIRRIDQDNYNRYFVQDLAGYQVPDGLLHLYDSLDRFNLLQEISRPIVGAPAGNWMGFTMASIPLEHLVYLMENADQPRHHRLSWPFNECNGPAGCIEFIRQAEGVMAILDAIFGTKSMSMAHWCATAIVHHINMRTRLGLHLMSLGLRASAARNEVIQVRGTGFAPVPKQVGFSDTNLHIPR